MNCTIPANPDISGIGVRSAIYAQNLLSFAPAIAALVDNKVTPDELQTIKPQSVTTLITTSSVLISTILQAHLFELTVFHAAVVLNLSLMSSTNSFIYSILCNRHNWDPNGKGLLPISVQPDSWKGCILRRLSTRLLATIFNAAAPNSVREHSGTTHALTALETPWRRISRLTVFILGSLNLTLMSSIGLWVWSDPRRFELRSTGASCSVDHASLGVIWASAPLSSPQLRVFFLFHYSSLLIPIFNLMAPLAYIIVLDFLDKCILKTFGMKGSAGSEMKTRPITIGLGVLFALNVMILWANEQSIAGIRNIQEPGESSWTFGQVLSLLSLSIPICDVITCIMHRNSDR